MVGFDADLHLHIDHDPERNHWHGIPAPELANAIHDARLDVCALTEHNKVGQDIFDLRAELERLTEHERFKVLCLLGVELSLVFDGFLYHVGYVFEDQFTPQTLPGIPTNGSSMEELEALKKAHSGIAILFHPTWKGEIPSLVSLLLFSNRRTSESWCWQDLRGLLSSLYQ